MRRRDFLQTSAVVLAGAGTGLLPPKWAAAQGRGENLRVLSEGAPNAFDPLSIGVNRNALQVIWNCYDRLIGFGAKPRDDGTDYFDYFDLRPEIAERWEVSPDKKTITFHLRRNAVFHDGTPVTAADVKWSFDRIVASPVGKAQFATGSMTSPDQFAIVDEYTFRVSLPQPDRFALPNIALTYPIIINAKLAKAKATAQDPWANEFLKTNIAGGGAFKVETFNPGERVVFVRFDDWKNGSLPGFRRVLSQTVPAAETRLSSLERGDADIAQDLPPKDAVALAKADKVKVVGVPMAGAFQFIGMNGQTKPFDNVKVRQAIAYALPYRPMFEAALFGRGRPLFGGKPGAPETTEFPQPLGYDQDQTKAKQLLAEAGYPNGFETTFTFEQSLATVAEPLSLLVQEALGQVGIKVTINKVANGQLGTLLTKKEVPFFFEASSAYLADPDYFFRIFYHGDTRWNFGSYKNPEFMSLVEKTRFEPDQAAYEAMVKRMITLAKEEIPIILLWQPTLDTGMQKSVAGYRYLFHRQLDLRTLRRV